MFWNKNKIPDLKLEADEDRDIDYFTMEDEKESQEEKEETIKEELHSEESTNLEQEEIKEAAFEESDDSIEDEENNDEEETQKKTLVTRIIDIYNEKNITIINKILNILIITIVIISALIITDVVLVSRSGKGPYFALNTKTHKDGGTKEYYGLGYKVIKYNEEEGRKDTIIGNWSLNYDTTPLKITILDLALEFNNDIKSSLDAYMNKYLKVSGKISKIEEDKITLIYKDDEQKYTTKLTCNILNGSQKYKKNDSVTIVGTLYNYHKDNTLKLDMKNCYLKK